MHTCTHTHTGVPLLCFTYAHSHLHSHQSNYIIIFSFTHMHLHTQHVSLLLISQKQHSYRHLQSTWQTVYLFIMYMTPPLHIRHIFIIHHTLSKSINNSTVPYPIELLPVCIFWDRQESSL